MKIALLAAISLGIANVFAVLMVQAESRGRPVMAGLTEVLFWFCNILCVRWVVKSFSAELAIFCSISAFLSTYLATRYGHKNIVNPVDAHQDTVLDSLKKRLSELEKSGDK